MRDISYGSDTPEGQLIERFLVKHGFMGWRAMNQNPGLFDKDLQDGLSRFFRTANIHLPTDRISDATVGSMLSWEHNYPAYYRQHPDHFGAGARTLLLDPSSLMLTDAKTGQHIPLSAFHARRVTYTIDAGHGVNKRGNGPDRGSSVDTRAGRLYEYQVTYNLALHAAAAFNARGCDVIITRNSETQIPVDLGGDGFRFRTTAGLASTAGYISLHTNIAETIDRHGIHHPKLSAQGTRIYSHASLDGTGAGALLRSDLQHGHYIHDDKVRLQHYIMISPGRLGYSMPAALIEAGFLTNPTDRDHLTRDTGWQNHFSGELADTFIGFNNLTPLLTDLRNGHLRTRTIPATPTRAETPQPAPHGKPAPRPAAAGPLPHHPPARPEQVASIVPPQVVTRTEAEGSSYGALAGDTLIGISRQFGIDFHRLKQANPDEVRSMHPDDEVILPGTRDIIVAPHATLFSAVGDFYKHDRSLQEGEPHPSQKQLAELIARINGVDLRFVKPGAGLVAPASLHEADEMLGRLHAMPMPAARPAPAAPAAPQPPAATPSAPVLHPAAGHALNPALPVPELIQGRPPGAAGTPRR